MSELDSNDDVALEDNLELDELADELADVGKLTINSGMGGGPAVACW